MNMFIEIIRNPLLLITIIVAVLLGVSAVINNNVTLPKNELISSRDIDTVSSHNTKDIMFQGDAQNKKALALINSATKYAESSKQNVVANENTVSLPIRGPVATQTNQLPVRELVYSYSPMAYKVLNDIELVVGEMSASEYKEYMDTPEFTYRIALFSLNPAIYDSIAFTEQNMSGRLMSNNEIRKYIDNGEIKPVYEMIINQTCTMNNDNDRSLCSERYSYL